jgi:signal transduction histidine kinase
LKSSLGSNIQIEKEYDATLIEIEANQGQLNQVFMNILNNAVQALETKGGLINITTRSDKDNAVIIISDNGKGIPKALQQKIFDPFFTTKEVGKGTGLGLSITYGIVKMHGGTIEIESEEGEGASFCIILPVKQNRP